MVKNPPCNAGGAEWVPGLGTKIPRGVEQLSRSTASTEPVDHNLASVCYKERSRVPACTCYALRALHVPAMR